MAVVVAVAVVFVVGLLDEGENEDEEESFWWFLCEIFRTDIKNNDFLEFNSNGNDDERRAE